MALVLGINKLLAMAKDTEDLHPIVISEIFFQLINQFGGSFQEHLSPINSKFQPLEAMKPSFLASEPSLTYTLIGL